MLFAWLKALELADRFRRVRAACLSKPIKGKEPLAKCAAHGPSLAFALVLMLGSCGVSAQALRLDSLSAQANAQGVWVDYTAQLKLPPPVEHALRQGIALHFEATASLTRYRWYWEDKTLASSTKRWRLSYQPLTGQWRMRLGSYSQNFPNLNQALSVMTRASQWRLSDALPAQSDRRYSVKFSLFLDTGQLPRPLQIGIEDEPQWNLRVDREIPLPVEEGR